MAGGVSCIWVRSSSARQDNGGEGRSGECRNDSGAKAARSIANVSCFSTRRKGDETELREARKTRGLLPVQIFIMTFLKLLPSFVKGSREGPETFFLNEITSSTEVIYVFWTNS